MGTAKTQPRSRKFLKLSLITIGIIIVAAVGLHIWFVNNARGVLKDMVHTKSNGKLKLELSKLTFEFFSRKLQIREADLNSTDTADAATTYHIKFRKLTLRINSFWPLLFQKKLLLDSIKLHDPEVEVAQWRRDTTQRRTGDELSVPQEMGKLYNSMLDVLDDFGIRRIIVNNAQVSLINKMKALSDPVTISNIYFDLKRTATDIKKRDDYVENEQSIELETTDQNITLPGGRHRLAFKKFHLELFNKRIQLDSCTLSALATDSSKSSYTIFFNKLMLVGVDFGAMYRQNLIRADSVYCENPQFNINLNTRSGGTKKKDRPDPEAIIQELTGDLDLAFIGVKDAGIHIDITGRKNRSLFNSNKDDFEMRGLRINADSTKPVVVERFDMLVRDYRLYSADSTASYIFDSIHFVNNKIVLSNFAVATELNRQQNHNYRDFRIPYFELTGLDWYELVFEQNVKAREARLFSPVINYVSARTGRRSKKKTNLFSALASIGDLVSLDKVNVVNGQINMKLGPFTSFNLQNADLTLFSNELLRSRNGEGLLRAVDRLAFSNGVLQLKNVTAEMQNVRSTPANLIQADRINLTSADKKIKGFLTSVVINNMLLDDVEETIVVDGIRWRGGTLSVQSAGGSGGAAGSGSIEIRNVAGTNTSLNFRNGNTSVSTLLTSLRLASLVKEGASPARMEGLQANGQNLSFKKAGTSLRVDGYQVAGAAPSVLSGVRLLQYSSTDSLTFAAPRIDFTADINSLLAGDMQIADVHAVRPDIIMVKRNGSEAKKTETAETAFRIDRIRASEPLVNITLHKRDSSSLISLPRSANSSIEASDLAINKDGVQLGSLSAKTTAVTFVKPSGEIVGVKNGVVDMQFSDLRLNRGKTPSWSGLINNLYLQNPTPLSLGKSKNQLLIDQVTLGNVSLSSAYLSNFNELVKYNVSAWLRTGTGRYIDSTTTLNWYNAEYSYKNKTLTLDSFQYHPTQPRDSVVARTPYQTDYITFRSGSMRITDFNLEKYKSDTSIFANTIHVTNPVITIYRDKQPPFRGGRIKPLPTDMIQNIRLPVSIQKLNLYDGLLSYTERNAKTRAEGTLLLTHLNAGLSHIKNRNISGEDSLSLTLNAFLMDSAQLNLRVRQSYTDSLNGFLMTLRMRPTTLSFLNPVLAPLSNVIIQSGTVDSFHLRAIGREELAFGEMNMYYRGLKIRLVKDGQEDQSTFLQKVVSFLANTFLIKKNNNGRTGLVYFERLRDRSFFNYIVKITFSGMATSVGAKKNRKVRKLYERQLKERELPPIEFGSEPVPVVSKREE